MFKAELLTSNVEFDFYMAGIINVVGAITNIVKPFTYPAIINSYFNHWFDNTTLKSVFQQKYYPTTEIKRLYYSPKKTRNTIFRHPDYLITKQDDLVKIIDYIKYFYTANFMDEGKPTTTNIKELVDKEIKVLSDCRFELPALISIVLPEYACISAKDGSIVLARVPTTLLLSYDVAVGYMRARKNKLTRRPSRINKIIDRTPTFENYVVSLFEIKNKGRSA